MKRKMWQQRQKTDNPNQRFLVEAVSNLARSIQNLANTETVYMLDGGKSGQLSDNEKVVWLPNHEFIEKLFLQAKKPRIINTLCKALLHHVTERDTFMNLWNTV
jgi:hypothetical protein